MFDPVNYSACWGCALEHKIGRESSAYVWNEDPVVVPHDYWVWTLVSTCPIHRYVDYNDTDAIFDWNRFQWIRSDRS